MDTLQTLERVHDEAIERSEGDDRFARLAEIAKKAYYWEGSLQMFAARAAMAELLDHWMMSVTNGRDPDHLMETDIPLVTEELENFMEHVNES